MSEKRQKQKRLAYRIMAGQEVPQKRKKPIVQRSNNPWTIRNPERFRKLREGKV